MGSEVSASTYVYPLRYLEAQYELSRDDIIILDGLTADEIITAVAKNKANAGVLAKFRLDRARGNGHRFIDAIELVPDFEVRIPNGGYVLSQSLSKDDEKMTRIRDRIGLLDSGTRDQLHPALAFMTEEDRNILLEHYQWVNPRDFRPLILLLVSTLIVTVVMIVFLLIYRPTGKL